jgi:hypothetical protein
MSALALPAALLLSWLAPWVIALLFERGSFTAENTQRVSDVLRFAALQIPFYILGSLASRVVVAMQATRFIIVLASVAVVGNATFNWLLMQRYGAAGIALSTVLVQMISAAMSCMFVLRMIRGKLDEVVASERVDEKAGAELRLEPGAFRRHDLSRVGDIHQLPHGDGVHGKSDGCPLGVDLGAQIICAADPADEIDPLARTRVVVAEDGGQDIVL